MGFVGVAVEELMLQRTDWPVADCPDAEVFVDRVIGDIRRLLGIGPDEGRKVAMGLWQELQTG